MQNWLIWLVLIALAVLALTSLALKQRKGHPNADGAQNAEEEAALDREGTFAMLVRDRSRHARNYANDMVDERFNKSERGHSRQKYEDAKSRAFTNLLTINDDFYRGVATHGVIDLLMAGGELAAAKRLLETLDQSFQASILVTKPEQHACLHVA